MGLIEFILIIICDVAYHSPIYSLLKKFFDRSVLVVPIYRPCAVRLVDDVLLILTGSHMVFQK